MFVQNAKLHIEDLDQNEASQVTGTGGLKVSNNWSSNTGLVFLSSYKLQGRFLEDSKKIAYH